MQDFLLNKDFSMLNTDNLIPLESTGVFTMSRTIQMIFNVENRTFDLGYLNFEIDRSVRKAVVHSYYLCIDTRLSQFIEFLVTISPDQVRQSKINNIRQIMLKVTFAKGQVFYNLIIKGETTGVMTFKPSEFKNCEKDVETDLSSIEPLINSIINEEEKPVPVYSYLRFHLDYPNKLVITFKVNYSDHDYFKNRGNHIYDVVVDSHALTFLEFLRTHYPTVNPISSDVEEIYVRVSEKKIASLIIYGTNNSQYEQIDFVPRLIEDSDSSNSLPNFALSSSKKVAKKHSEVVDDSVNPAFLNSEKLNVKQQIITVCKEITDSRNQTSQKIDELRDLLTSLSVLDEKKEPKIKEVIHRVYKKQIGFTGVFVHVGTRNLKDEAVFRLPVWSESRRKDLQNSWNVYEPSFYCQTTTVYEDDTTKLGTMKQFVPTNNIQEIESSNRTGTIACLIQAAGLAEIVYYDRYVK